VHTHTMVTLRDGIATVNCRQIIMRNLSLFRNRYLNNQTFRKKPVSRITYTVLAGKTLHNPIIQKKQQKTKRTQVGYGVLRYWITKDCLDETVTTKTRVNKF